jgi:hypothetical protein
MASPSCSLTRCPMILTPLVKEALDREEQFPFCWRRRRLGRRSRLASAPDDSPETMAGNGRRSPLPRWPSRMLTPRGLRVTLRAAAVIWIGLDGLD